MEAELDLFVDDFFDGSVFDAGQLPLFSFAVVQVCTGLEEVFGTEEGA